MLDTNKLPHLQPNVSSSKEDVPEESLTKQIISAFSSKKGITYLCLSFLLVYLSMCLQGEHLLRQGVYSFFKELGQNGFGVSYDAPSSYLAYKSGLVLDNLVIIAPEKLGGWKLNAGRISVSSSPFTKNSVFLETNGTHSLTTKTIKDIRLIIGEGKIKIRLPSKNRPFSVNMNFKQIQTAAPKSMEGFFVSDLSITAKQNYEQTEKKEFINFDINSKSVQLPAYMRVHLPPIIQSFKFEGILSDTKAHDAPSLVQSWLNNSGTIELKQGEIFWDPFDATLTGTFGLNDSFDLIGAGVFKAHGFFALIDMLQKGEYLRSRRVSVAKIVLGEQVKTEPSETKPSLKSAFSIQSGKFYIGQVLLHDDKE